MTSRAGTRRPRPLQRRWAQAACWLVAWLLALPLLPAQLPAAQAALTAAAAPEVAALVLDQAEVAIADPDPTLPPVAGWQPQRLPDAWHRHHPALAGSAWYRLRFDRSALASGPLVLYVAQVAVTGQFRLNGVTLNPQVRFDTPGGAVGSQMTNIPQWLPLPPELLRPGPNELLVRVEGNPVTGGHLSALHVGTPEALRGAFLLRHVPQQVLPQALLLLLLLTLALASALWRRARQPLSRHAVAALLPWAALIAGYLHAEAPLSARGLAVGLALLTIAHYWTTLGLCWRFAGGQWRRFPRLLHVCGALTIAAVLAMAAADLKLELLGALLLPWLLLRALTAVMLVQWATGRPGPAPWSARTAWALVATELLWFAGSLQFVAIRLGWLPNEPFMLSPAASLPLFLVLLFLWVSSFRIDHRLALQERQAAIDAERARILHDVHDGMGAQLITTLRLARQPGASPVLVARGIDAALQDLRLIIDSLDLADQDLLPLLGNLRYRLEPQLNALGITLDWQVQPLPALAGLKPHSALMLLRIVQEALNNAVSHARARSITVAIAPWGAGMELTVSDDGIGFDGDGAHPGGYGLAGMRRRADHLGATLRWTRDSTGGTCVTLRLAGLEPRG